MNGAVSGFGPLIVNTFGWSVLHSIVWQFPLGAICFVAILVTGYLGSRIRNIRLIMLVITCLPVMAGCALIWKSEWTYRAAAPVVGYSITGFFGATVSLVITVGMSNVAGHTKKSFMAATIFAAYCVGNIVGPLMVRSQTREQHYPELWLGLIIWYVSSFFVSDAVLFPSPRQQTPSNHPQQLCDLYRRRDNSLLPPSSRQSQKGSGRAS
jgi:MFS family permease